MPLEDIKERVLSAIVDLYRYDGDLLDSDANERSITHKLAEHLQLRFPSWNVDCEYNRWFGEPKRINATIEKLAKVLVENVAKEDSLESTFADMIAATEARTVFPDVIVHKRGRPDNLMVIEVKKHSNTSSRESDEHKLKAFTVNREFRYRIGLLLEIGTTHEAAGITVYSRGKERLDLSEDWKTTLDKRLEVLGYGG